MSRVAVVGLGFGDEGKGHVVDWLCSEYRNNNPSVIRFSGGHQAAHHVVRKDGRDHVFAHFGSGSFEGVPTYWSKYCPVNPVALLHEYNLLREKGVQPLLYIDPKCPVTTPYEIAWTQANGRIHFHGTCGTGIYATWEREKAHYSLLMEDLVNPFSLLLKLSALAQYPEYREERIEPDVQEFLEACRRLSDTPGIVISTDMYCGDRAVGPFICEGSQGLLLDQNYGFFPHVTPSNTGTTNLLEMGLEPHEIYLVTRAYQTRHGNGPMGMMVPNNIKPNPWEQNTDDGPQGKFRQTLLDLDMLRYARSKDPWIRDNKCNLVITCMDLVENEHRLISAGEIIQCQDEREFVRKIQEAVGVGAGKTYLSDGPILEDITPL